MGVELAKQDPMQGYPSDEHTDPDKMDAEIGLHAKSMLTMMTYLSLVHLTWTPVRPI